MPHQKQQFFSFWANLLLLVSNRENMEKCLTNIQHLLKCMLSTLITLRTAVNYIVLIWTSFELTPINAKKCIASYRTEGFYSQSGRNDHEHFQRNRIYLSSEFRFRLMPWAFNIHLQQVFFHFVYFFKASSHLDLNLQKI